MHHSVTSLLRDPAIRSSGPLTLAMSIAAGVGIWLGTSAFLVPEREAAVEPLIGTLAAEAVQLCQDNQWDQESVEILDRYLRTTSAIEPITEELLRKARTIPPAQRAIILDTLLTRALTDGDPAGAETIRWQLLDAADRLSRDLARPAVTSSRCEHETGPDTVEPRETADVTFELLKRDIDATEDPASLRGLIPAAVQAGIEARQQTSLIPLYLRYLDVAKDRKDDPLISLYTFRLALTYDWTNRPSEAFDRYLGLARLGHRVSLERCRLLNHGLGRDADLLSALIDGRAHYESDDELLLLTARLLSEAARPDEAIAACEKLLARHPGEAWALEVTSSIRARRTQHLNTPEAPPKHPLLP
jgi:tetratricopeptide (TPR) repeat protein